MSIKTKKDLLAFIIILFSSIPLTLFVSDYVDSFEASLSIFIIFSLFIGVLFVCYDELLFQYIMELEDEYDELKNNNQHEDDRFLGEKQ
jgi:hypothetical protein